VPSLASSQPAETASAELPRDLTPLGMFMSAEMIMKAVFRVAELRSYLTWTRGKPEI
jgi:hypothetical protein